MADASSSSYFGAPPNMGRASALLRAHAELRALDEEIVTYLAALIADGDPAAVGSAEALSASLGPFLESCGLAPTEAEGARLCGELFHEGVAQGVIKAAPPAAANAAAAAASPSRGRGGGRGGAGAGAGGGGLGLGGMSASQAASLRALAAMGIDMGGGGGGEDGEDGENGGESGKLLRAPVKLGSSAGGADSAALDFLWGRENNAYLNRNQLKEFGEGTREARKIAKAEEKRGAREAAKSEYESAKEASAAKSAALKSGAAVTSGAVTYVPVVDRKQQDIAMTGVNIGYGGALLIEDAELRLNMGRRYGLVGRNGYGKTTLLHHMARHDVFGSGAQRFPTNIRVLHVEQEISGSSDGVLAAVLAADVERDALLQEEALLHQRVAMLLAEAEAAAAAHKAAVDAAKAAGLPPPPAPAPAPAAGVASASAAAAAAAGGGAAAGAATSVAAGDMSTEAAQKRMKEVAQRLQAIDSESAEARASQILSGLGFSTAMLKWPTSALSGGWRMRVALACALFVQPDVLLLDEPTNHLDVPSCMWLEEYMTAYPCTCVVVSHDRRFLNAVVTDVIYLTNKKLEYYKGDYDTFERTRTERSKMQARAGEAQDARRAHIQSFIDRFRYNANRAALVQSRIKALERMEVMEEVADDPRWKFEFPDPGPLGVPVLQVSDVAFGYDLRAPLFRGANFSVDLDSRIALVGPNGAGKSTLVKLLLGELEPQAGVVTRNSKLRAALFTQHHVAQLDMSQSPLDFLTRVFPGNKPEAIRAHLSQFGVTGELALQRISTLSGGQKSRVAFALCSWRKPHLLVLDEPTNHLDIETIDALIVALGSFQGGVVIVSHDAHFIESVASDIWIVGEGRVAKHRGDFNAYRRIALGEKVNAPS